MPAPLLRQSANGSLNTDEVPDNAATVGFRPRRARISDTGHIRGNVALIERLGDTSMVHVNVDGVEDQVIVTARRSGLNEGDNVGIDLDLKYLLYFDADENRIAAGERVPRQ